MKNYLIIILLLYGGVSRAQLSEDFTDGEFLSNPAWTGSNAGSDFIVTGNRLRSNSILASSNFYLSTASNLALNSKWEFWLNFQFSTSGSNYSDIYLVSDKEDLRSNLINGYFVRIGNSEDEVSLYKRSGPPGSSVRIIDGVNGSIASTNNTIRIKVSRTSAGLFTLERETVTSGSSYIKEGTVTDLTFTSSSYFGVYVQQSTSSFFQKHFFDDFRIGYLVSDTIPPVLGTVSVIDSNTLEVTFSEAMDSLSVKINTNFSISNIGQPTQVLTTTDQAKFRLKLAKSLSTGTFVLSVNNMKDQSGNLIGNPKSASFNFITPYTAKLKDLVINEVFADPSPQIDLPSVEFVELINTSNETISLKNWKFTDQTSSGTFGSASILPHSLLIICAKSDTAEYLRFGKVLGISPWPSLNNSGDELKLISPDNVIIDALSYTDNWYQSSTKRTGGWSLERIDPLTKCEGQFNWTASRDSSGGTPGRQNSVYVSGYDLLELKADSLKQISDTTVSIYFNKHLDASTLLAGNFILKPDAGNIKKISADAEVKQVSLIFTNRFTADTTYELAISDVRDCAGGVIATKKLNFKTPAIPPPAPERTDTAKLFITEIFADPSPEVGLPLVEFIEIYNPGLDTINLEGWTISDPQTIGKFKKTLILPKEYLVLCPAADTVQYKSFGKTLGILPWPSLNNSSDLIVLKSFKNRTVDSVAFADTWYHNAMKKQGGWSLEKRDLFSKCEGQFNWTASRDSSGGTPGRQNSVYVSGYDLLELKADSLKQISDTTVRIYFNKHLDASTLLAGNFILKPDAGNIKKISADAEVKQVSLIFTNRFTADTTYELAISNVRDCAGGVIATKKLNFKTPAIPPPAPERTDTAKLFITEIFADPSPEVGLPLVEFIEIYNPGLDTINLEGWTISDPQTIGKFKKTSILPKEYLVLCPAADTLQYKSYGKALGILPWPSLNNSSDLIVLKSFKNRTVDSVAFADTWYHDAMKKQGGWGLEKRDLFSKCEGQFNWTASRDSSGGTPGRQNSVYVSGYDLLELKADSLKQISDTTVSIYFNKHLDASTLLAGNFILKPDAGNIKKISADAEVKQVSLTFSKRFAAGTAYELAISEVKDCAGGVIATKKLNFKTPAIPAPVPERTDTAKLFITEIFADPSPEVGLPLVEFIEIYNPGLDTINLEGWTISDPGSKAILKKVNLLPLSYLILCPAADTLQYKSFGKTLGISPWPSLNNSSDLIVLKSFKNRTVDSVAFADTWYHDAMKKQGGWSLEKVVLNNKSCAGFYNWEASADPRGGTPGKVNSMIKNLNSILKINSLALITDSTILISLTQIPDTAFIKPLGFRVNNGIGSARKAILTSDYKKIFLEFGSKFREGHQYELTVDSMFTCNGILIAKPDNQAFFSIPSVPEIDFPLIINEIFADPLPAIDLPETEFVELYNPGEKPIALKGMYYGDLTRQFQFDSGEIAPGGYLILCPAKDTLSFLSYGKVIGLPVWPELNNESDILILKNNKGREIHRVTYGINWYKDPVKSKGGYSLELIDPASTCSSLQNWSASQDSAGGTPGKRNSIHQAKSYSDPLKLMNVILLDSVTLLLTFNRYIDSLSASISNNFTLNNGVGSPLSAIPDGPHFMGVKLKFPEITRGHTYRITASGITDCKGTTILSGNNTFEFILTNKIYKNDILINEILFNPRPDGVDFIEIYNNAPHPLNLQELSLARLVMDSVSNIQSLAKSHFIMQPGTYLVLTSNPQSIKKEYFTQNPDSFLKLPSFPSFNDDTGTALLFGNGFKIDQFSYTEKMHFPLIKNVEGVSLERSSLKHGANEPGNFRSATSAVGYATPGYKNSQYQELQKSNEEFSLVSKTFSPDNDGFEDILQINYSFPNPGLIADIKIFNGQGTLIRRLYNNYILNAEGTLIWDGLNESAQLVPTGIYVLQAQILDTAKGNLKTYRKACVLARKF